MTQQFPKWRHKVLKELEQHSRFVAALSAQLQLNDLQMWKEMGVAYSAQMRPCMLAVSGFTTACQQLCTSYFNGRSAMSVLYCRCDPPTRGQAVKTSISSSPNIITFLPSKNTIFNYLICMISMFETLLERFSIRPKILVVMFLPFSHMLV